ncbi:unnamed protein product [Sphagnum jensenii]
MTGDEHVELAQGGVEHPVTLASTSKAVEPAKLFQDSYGSCAFSPSSDRRSKTGQYLEEFWTTEFSSQLCTESSKALATIFDEKGDQERVGKQADHEDALTRKILSSHKKGEHWQDGGTSYYIDQSGDLIAKDKKGLHFVGANGLRYDGNRKEGQLSLNGETVTRRGDKYLKKFPDGQEYEITDGEDKAAIVKIEGLVFEQRMAVLKELNRAGLEMAREKGSRIVTASDGVAIYKVDNDENVIARNTREHGTFVLAKSTGQIYHIDHGQVYAVHGDHTQTEVKDSDLPKFLSRRADGSIVMGSVTIGPNNDYADRDHGIHMTDLDHKVTATTGQKEITASVSNGVQEIQTPQRDYRFDEAGGLKFTVTRADQSIDSVFDFAASSLNTDGVEFTPIGMKMNGLSFDVDNSFSDGILTIFNTEDDDYNFRSIDAEEDARGEATDSQEDVTDALADIALATPDRGDLSELEADLLSLQNSQAVSGLSDDSKVRLSNQIGSVLIALARLTQLADTAQNTATAFGFEDNQLTKEVIALGGDAGAVSAILQKYSLHQPQTADTKSI